MVNKLIHLDAIFRSLSDPTRRNILERLFASSRLTVSEIAHTYDVSLADISKHLKILERASLIRKQKVGRHVYVSALPETLSEATEYLALHSASRTGARQPA